MLIRKSLVALIAAIFVLTSLPGCILDPKESVEEVPVEPVEWPDRTDREDVIEIVLLVYETEDIEKYKEVLLKPDSHDDYPEGFYWFHQIEDVRDDAVSEDYWGYTVDWQTTGMVLDHEAGLELKIYPGTWESEDDFRGIPCDDCWKTIRGYKIDITLDDGRHFISDYYVQFVIGPDPDNQNKYVIYAMRDLREGAQ
ncbi:MAG: hypothetical protein GF417_02785 [Candidatus Latescibacteria bacterium]|nr:hypothetical protein [bacterium]MBD3423355.1 hypothetical protein [Candidatus Latescibacterota bacterium]